MLVDNLHVHKPLDSTLPNNYFSGEPHDSDRIQLAVCSKAWMSRKRAAPDSESDVEIPPPKRSRPLELRQHETVAKPERIVLRLLDSVPAGPLYTAHYADQPVYICGPGEPPIALVRNPFLLHDVLALKLPLIRCRTPLGTSSNISEPKAPYFGIPPSDYSTF